MNPAATLRAVDSENGAAAVSTQVRQNGHAPAADCRVLIADDDENFAELLTLLLGEHSEINVVGRARDGPRPSSSPRRSSRT